MRAVATWGLAAMLLGGSALVAAEIESGLKVGEGVPAFQVVKIGGADDGVENGKQLCYR